MINKNLKAALYSIIAVATLAIYTVGCADDPSSLGLNFIPPGETTGVRIFDSYIDTMPITSGNFSYYVNTSNSSNLMVGKNGNYESKALLKFTNIGDSYDSAVVISAKMYLKYKNYFFPSSVSDSLGQISFEVFQIQHSYDFSQITNDSVNSTSFGNISKGSYTGIPTADSQEVEISLNTSMVKDWLEYAADTTYPAKNFGIVLSPNNSSQAVKGFYSATQSGSVAPRVQIILSKNNVNDTFTTTSNSSITLSTTSFAPSNETFNLQAGVSYIQQMHFDMNHIPASATINDVKLYLTLDSAGSIFSSQSNYQFYAQFINDTNGLKSDIYTFIGSSQGNGKYQIQLVASNAPSPFARWLAGEPNYGLLLFAGNQTINLDRYSFYKETAADPLKRPRVIIKYTPRVTP